MSTLYSSLDVNKPNNSHKFAHKKNSHKNIRNLKKKTERDKRRKYF